MTFVRLECVDGFAECTCGWRVPCKAGDVTIHNCGPGLGDAVAAGLSAIGITPERVAAVTGRPCNCKHRQQAINEWGSRVIGLPDGRPN